MSGWGVSGGPTFSPSSSIVSLIETRGYDALGNWLMPSKSKSSLEQTLIENGGSLTVEMAVEPRGDNSVMTIHAQQNQRAVGLDGARRICTDGEFQYVYDFFGRLSEVRRLGTLTVDQDGQLSGGDPGAWIRHFTYDGLGRLIRVQTPFPEPGDDTSVSERRFYDGHRVVQVVKTAPLSLGGAAPVPASFKPLSLEFEGETDEGEGVYRWIDWQLAWDPDGGDRLLCQMRLFSAEDETPRWMYVLSDGHGPPTPWGVLNGEGAVLSRVSFTPYGTVLRATMDGSTTWQDAWPVVGYQGLWGTRLDDKTGPPPSTGSGGGFGETPWGQWQTSPSGSDGLVAGHQPDAPRHVYDARNRAYMPWLGRWLQPDPLGTGLPVAMSMSVMGEGVYVGANDVWPEALFRDGCNRYEFVKSNPIARTDPMGLFFSLPDIITSLGARSGLQSQQAVRVGAASSLLSGAFAGNGLAAGMAGIVGVGGVFVFTYNSDLLMELGSETSRNADAFSRTFDEFAGSLTVYMASDRGKAIEKITSHLAVAGEHLARFTNGGGGHGNPNNPQDKKDWLSDAAKHLREARKWLTDQLGKKTLEQETANWQRMYDLYISRGGPPLGF